MNFDFKRTLLDARSDNGGGGDLHSGVITCSADVADVFVAIHRFLEVANVIG